MYKTKQEATKWGKVLLKKMKSKGWSLIIKEKYSNFYYEIWKDTIVIFESIAFSSNQKKIYSCAIETLPNISTNTNNIDPNEALKNTIFEHEYWVECRYGNEKRELERIKGLFDKIKELARNV